ncbi:MAG: hypothetical protein QNK37_31990 [Acidobacteriota bacterium]|nr:hypothetical protein [Acidobacteriota bacterium]
MTRLTAVIWLMLGTTLWAQHPFYMEALEKARSAMAGKAWNQAAEQLETAAFGLMNTPKALGEVYLRWALTAEQLGKQDLAEAKAVKARALLGEPMIRPEGITDDEWRQFKVLCGIQDPPPLAQEEPQTPPEAKPEKTVAAGETRPETPPEKTETEPAPQPRKAADETSLAPEETRRASVKTEPEPEPVPEQPEKDAEQPRAETAAPAAEAETPSELDRKFARLEKMMDRGSIFRARRLLTEVSKSGTGSTRYAEAYARLFYLKKYYNTVVDTFADQPGISDKTRYYLGLSYLEKGSARKAKATLAGLKREDFSDLDQIDQRIEAALPKTEDTVEPVHPVTEPLPQDAETTANRLEELVAAGEWARAREMVLLATYAWPDNKDIRFFQGRLHLHDRAYQRASAVFYRLANGGYQKREIFYYGGLAYYHMRDYALANYMFGRARQIGTAFENEIEAIQKTYRKRKAVAHN